MRGIRRDGSLQRLLEGVSLVLAGDDEDDLFRREQQGHAGSDRLEGNLLVSAPIRPVADDAFARQRDEAGRGVLVGWRLIEFEMAIRPETD